MKKRYLYGLLFGIPGFFLSGIIALVVFGATLGVLWLFLFGDNAWPASTEPILAVLVLLTFLLSWIFSIVAGYAIGKKLETNPEWSRAHILVSAGLTVAFILFILLQQVSTGNLGPKSDSRLCSDFCVQQGYSGSGIPPAASGDRTCSCYDHSGKEALSVPLDSINTDARK